MIRKLRRHHLGRGEIPGRDMRRDKRYAIYTGISFIFVKIAGISFVLGNINNFLVILFY
jgi:hypothetical protein